MIELILLIVGVIILLPVVIVGGMILLPFILIGIGIIVVIMMFTPIITTIMAFDPARGSDVLSMIILIAGLVISIFLVIYYRKKGIV